MSKEELHIGRIINKHIIDNHVNRIALAQQINNTRQNIDNIVKRKSLDTVLLFNISNALKTNLFEHYTSQLNFITSEPSELTIQHLNEKITMLQKQIEIQEKLIAALEGKKH